MDFHEDDGHRARARAFASEEVAPSAAYRDGGGRWDSALFRRMGEAGLLGATVAPEDGGGGRTAMDLGQLFTGFGEGARDAGLALAWGKHTLGCTMPVVWSGNAAQRQRYLPDLCAGQWLGALAHAEASCAGDGLGLRTQAVRKGGGFTLNGSKTWVLNAPQASLFLITAITDPGRGKDGVSAFLVERGTPGLEVGPALATFGMRSAGAADLRLDDCHVPAEQLLGAAGAAMTDTLARIQRWERALLGAAWVGMLRALLDHCVARACERHELGRALAQSQAVRARLADMKIRNELCSRLSARAAWLLDHSPERSDREAAAARLFLAQTAARSSGDALSIFGVAGDPFAERLHRDAMVFEQLDGGTDRLRSILAGSLLNLG